MVVLHFSVRANETVIIIEVVCLDVALRLTHTIANFRQLTERYTFQSHLFKASFTYHAITVIEVELRGVAHGVASAITNICLLTNLDTVVEALGHEACGTDETVTVVVVVFCAFFLTEAVAELIRSAYRHTFMRNNDLIRLTLQTVISIEVELSSVALRVANAISYFNGFTERLALAVNLHFTSGTFHTVTVIEVEFGSVAQGVAVTVAYVCFDANRLAGDSDLLSVLRTRNAVSLIEVREDIIALSIAHTVSELFGSADFHTL